MSVLSAPQFHDETAAYAWVEAHLWPRGPVCPHCGATDRIKPLKGKSTRIGVRKCYHCYKPFTVKVGTIFEDSHIPLHKWLQAMHLLCSSKKGISTHQLHRTLQITLKSAWFLSHRIREADRAYREFGSIEGYFQGIERDGKGRRLALIRARLTGETVKCFVSETALPGLEGRQFADVWHNKRVQVYGRLHFRGLGKLSYITAEKFRFFRERSDLPQVEDIIDPDFTGGLRSEDYLESLRNGELS